LRRGAHARKVACVIVPATATRPTEAAEDVRRAVADARVALSERGEEIEAARRLPADVVGQLRDLGLFGLWLPAELGGLEAPPELVLDVLEQLSWADGSLGWCATVGVGTNALAARLPESGAREIFAGGREIAGGTLMPRGELVRAGDEAYVLSGEWSFASGIEHCDWVCAGAMRNGTARLAFLPAAGVEILDTWDVSGLRGTGSHDFRVCDAIVPARRVGSLSESRPWPQGALWQIPITTLLLPLLAAVPLGIARRAVDELIALAAAKVPANSTRRLCDRELTQATVARGHAMVASARGYLRETLEDLHRVARRGDAPTERHCAAARLAGVHAAQTGAEVAGLCYRLGGASALHRRSPLQRAFRDANAATQHYALSHTGYEPVGRVLLGVDGDAQL
jgi:indole-3-acetate monooxygenase